MARTFADLQWNLDFNQAFPGGAVVSGKSWAFFSGEAYASIGQDSDVQTISFEPTTLLAVEKPLTGKGMLFSRVVDASETNNATTETSTQAPVDIFTESFEGDASQYTISSSFNDGSNDHFGVTDGTGISNTSDAYSNFDGSNFVAGEDLDDTGGTGADGSDVKTIAFNAIDITGYSSLSLSAAFGAGSELGVDSGDYDALDWMGLFYRVDGGDWKIGVLFNQDDAGSDAFNDPLRQVDLDSIVYTSNEDDAVTGLLADTNYTDLISTKGTLTTLGTALQDFTIDLSGVSGSSLEVMFAAHMDSGDEEIAFDNLVLQGELAGPTTVLDETFETDGSGTRYAVLSGADAASLAASSELTDGSGDFFTRTDGSNIGSFYQVTGFGGSYYFAAQDIDGDAPNHDAYAVFFDDLDISGLSDLQFSGLFAEDDDAANQDWDADALVYVEIDIDNSGTFTKILQFASQGDTNTEPGLDTDFDGVADGAALTSAFAEFTAAIAGTGSVMDVRIVVENLDAGDEDIAFDNIQITGESGGPSDRISIAATDAAKAEGDSGTTSFTFTVTRTGDISGASSVDYAVTSTDADAADFGGSLPTGTVNFLANEDTAVITIDVSGDTDFEVNEDFTVTLSNPGNGETISTATAVGTIQNDDAVNATSIGQIQGTGDVSVFDGQTVTITGLVTGDFQTGSGEDGDIEGFFIQDAGDGDASTSDGIFIYDGGVQVTDVTKGDEVTVTGVVTERFGKTVIDITGGSFTIDSQNNDYLALMQTVDMSTITARSAQVGNIYRADLEAFESMLVNFQQTLTIIETNDMDAYNEFMVSADGRIETFTQQAANGDISAANNDAYLQSVGGNIFLIDDGFDGTTNPIQWPDGSFGTDDSFRLGNTSDDAFGIMDFGFSNFRLRGVDTDSDGNTFDEFTFDTSGNPRPSGTPDTGTGPLTIASMNVLNLFTTIDTSGATTDLGFDPRGADTAAEFQDQLDKIVNSILAIDSDIVGLVEIENDFVDDGNSAIQVLVDALNAELGSIVYDYVDPGIDYVGTDAISTGLIYKATEVRLAANATVEILDDTALANMGWTDFGDLGAIFDGPNSNRVPIAATFVENGTGERITVTVNHFKSKGGTGSGANADQNDGVSDWNEVRELGAMALRAWLATDPTGGNTDNYMILGDLNAYAGEDPINYLTTNGYNDLGDLYAGAGDYSYVYDGLTGTLDYAIASEALLNAVTGVAHWNGNADEAHFIDYNDGNPAGAFDGTTPWRASDHDPVVVGLNLALETGTDGADQVDGDRKDDIINGGDGSDYLDGRGGDDILNGEGGDDVLDGGEGADDLNGGSGRDAASYRRAASGVTVDLTDPNNNTGEAAGDTYSSIEMVFGSNDFADQITGSSDRDFLWGFGGDDVLNGLYDSDKLYGGAGADEIYGGRGHDLLEGGTGDDLLDGGRGKDDFLFAGTSLGADTVQNFEDGRDEFIFDSSTGVTGMGDLVINTIGDTTTVTFAEGSITIEHDLGDVIDSNDFTFI